MTEAHHSHDIGPRDEDGVVYLYCYNCRACSSDDPDRKLKKECDPNG